MIKSFRFMGKQISITPLGKEILAGKKKELERAIKGAKSDPILLAKQKMELRETDDLLRSAIVVEFDETTPASVQIGVKVTLENLKNNDKREYIIATGATADPLKGVLSNESPLAQKMLGLKLGNTFKFRDIAGIEDSYKIANIE